MKKFFAVMLLLFPAISVSAENFRVMFYNVENLFDTIDNPHKNDQDFLPQSLRRWTKNRYYRKIENLSKVITAAGEWDTPALIGMCEVENDLVMKDLTLRSALRKQDYRYIITDCGDRRGINVALLYQRDRFRFIDSSTFKIFFPKHPRKRTRDILHVSGLLCTGDTLDVFVCHFPSRAGGEEESEEWRKEAAGVLRKKIEECSVRRKRPGILVMGDFNDTPENESIHRVLGAVPSRNVLSYSPLLVNLVYEISESGSGSYFYRGFWDQLDQIMISPSLLNGGSLRYIQGSAKDFAPSFIMTGKRKKRPQRTYYGMKYEGGYSDHLPLTADFYIDN